MDRLEQIVARLEEIATELQTLHEKTEFDEADEARFEELTTELDELEEERVKLVARNKVMQRAQAAATDPENLIRGDAGLRIGTDPVDGDPIGNADGLAENRKLFDLNEVQRLRTAANGQNELRARARSAIEAMPDVPRMRGDDLFGDKQRERVLYFLDMLHDEDEDAEKFMRSVSSHILTVSSPEYIKAFNRNVRYFARTGKEHPDAEAVLKRAMSLTDAAGGYAVPLPIDPTLIKNYDVDVNPMREVATVIDVVTDSYRTVNSTLAAFSYDAEAAEVSDDATTFANIDIAVHKGQGLVPFSIEIGQDFPNFTARLGDLIADGKDDAEATVWATGTGTNQPIGIVTALTGGSYEVAANTTDTFALADVYDLDEEIHANWAARARWMANKRIYQAIRESGGANLDDFWANLGQGRPAQLLGHPVHEVSTMDGVINAGAENYVLVLGDFRNYYIVDRAGLSIELVPHLFATANNRPSGQRGFYVWWRNGGDSVNDRAFRMLNVT